MPVGAVAVAQGQSNNPNVTINSQAAASSFVVLVTHDAAANYSAIADTINGAASGNGWTRIGSAVNSVGGYVDVHAFYVSSGFNGGNTHRFSVTLSASAYWTISVLEITSVNTSTPISGTPVFAADAGSPFNSAGVTTTAPNTLLVGLCATDSTTDPATYAAHSSAAPTSGWTVRSGATYTATGTNWSLSQKTQAVTAAGTYQAGWTCAGASNSATGLIAFVDDGGGGGTAHALQGAATGAGTATGAASVSKPLGGAAQGGSSATGAATVDKPLGGAAQGAGSAAGAATVGKPLGGSAQGAGTAAGELAADRQLTVTLYQRPTPGAVAEPLANATGLWWAWWSTFAAFLAGNAPTARGSGATTDANGVFLVQVEGVYTPGTDQGFGVIGNLDATPDLIERAYVGTFDVL